jgi:hypothetical protein
MRDRVGLARARSGQDRDRSPERERRLALGVVQPGKDGLEISHRADPSVRPGRTRRFSDRIVTDPTNRARVG